MESDYDSERVWQINPLVRPFVIASNEISIDFNEFAIIVCGSHHFQKKDSFHLKMTDNSVNVN